MQISGQNNNTTPLVPQPQYNSSYNCGAAAPTNGTTVQEPCQAPPQVAYPCGYYYPQGVPIPQQAPMPQAPTASGVNIQIYSPTVGPSGGCYYPPPYTIPMPSPQPVQIPQAPVQQTPPQTQPTEVQQATVPTLAPEPAPTQPTETQAPVKTEETPEKKKTQKRKIVVLTDDYIKNLASKLKIVAPISDVNEGENDSLPQVPYKYLHSYEQNEHALFFGREKERGRSKPG